MTGYRYNLGGRLICGLQGFYTYGDAAHLDAATAIGAAYTAAYDAAGRLATWASQPTNPSATDAFLYDGQGDRVAQQATQNGTTTTTVYVGDLEEISTSGSSTTTTAYYYMDGQRFAEAVNGALSFLASDALGSAEVAFDASGNVEGQVLYAPYGAVRYVSGTMPTDYGFTGQRADALTGLDYFNARYYDAAAGQFASADTALPGGGKAQAGLNRYAYVGDSPVNATDPSGHMVTDCPTCDSGGGTPNPPTNTPPPGPPGGCVSEISCNGDGGPTTTPTPTPTPPTTTTGCGGCAVRPPPSATSPSQQQINNAKNEARSTAGWFLDAAFYLGGLGGLLSVVAKFTPGKQAAILADAAFTAVALAAVLYGEFNFEAAQNLFFWKSPTAVHLFADAVLVTLGLFAAAVVALDLALGSLTSEMPEAAAGLAYDAAIGFNIGVVAGLGLSFPKALRALDTEWQDLGYSGDPILGES